MAIKNILAHIDHSETCNHRVKAAIDMAKQNNAQLSALLVVPDYCSMY